MYKRTFKHREWQQSKLRSESRGQLWRRKPHTPNISVHSFDCVIVEWKTILANTVSFLIVRQYSSIMTSEQRCCQNTLRHFSNALFLLINSHLADVDPVHSQFMKPENRSLEARTNEVDILIISHSRDYCCIMLSKFMSYYSNVFQYSVRTQCY